VLNGLIFPLFSNRLNQLTMRIFSRCRILIQRIARALRIPFR
jgi:hypothetical protein